MMWPTRLVRFLVETGAADTEHEVGSWVWGFAMGARIMRDHPEYAAGAIDALDGEDGPGLSLDALIPDFMEALPLKETP